MRETGNYSYGRGGVKVLRSGSDEFRIYSGGLTVYKGQSETVVVPEEITRIGRYVFADNDLLKNVVLPQGLQIIEKNAFAGCTALERVLIPSSTVVIEEDAFNGCVKLKECVLNEGLTVLGANAFFGCVSLEKIRLPDSLEIIGESAFFKCEALSDITIPIRVSEAGDGIFGGCISLERISLAEGNRNFAEIDGNLYSQNGSKIVAYAPGKKESVFAIPEGTKKIGQYAFHGCTALREAILPEGMTLIGAGAFLNCSNLCKINLPDTVNTVGVSAFHNCSSLTKITVPEGVTALGWGVFWDCAKLCEAVLPLSLVRLDSKVFKKCDALERILCGSEIARFLDYALCEKTLDGFLKRLADGLVSEEEKLGWTETLGENIARAFGLYRDRCEFYKFALDNRLLPMADIESVLEITADNECRALLLDYRNKLT